MASYKKVSNIWWEFISNILPHLIIFINIEWPCKSWDGTKKVRLAKIGSDILAALDKWKNAKSPQ